MSLEQTVTETIERHVDAVPAPRIDLAAVRRVGRRRARIRASLVAACAAVLVGGGAYAVGLGGDTNRADDVPPVDLPRMDFANGLRAWYDQEAQRVEMGGEAFDIGRVENLDTSASTTPYGLVFFGADQDVRLLRDDGSVRVLDPAPDEPRPFHPTVKFDAARPLAAWLTRDASGVRLAVYRFGSSDGLVGRFPAPCDCDPAMAGVDQGLVFVRGDGATWQLDPRDGASADWHRVADVEVTDVRNRVLLVEGRARQDVSLPAGWRVVQAQGPESLLTFDGEHELYWSTTLRATTPGAAPLELAMPAGKGTDFVNMDSDGSVLVARASNGQATVWDCEVTARGCQQIAETRTLNGDPVFIGNDM